MPTVARIQAQVGATDVEFNNVLDRAEKRAQTFGGRVSTSLTQAFRRSPHMRAERAFTGLFESLASGDVATGIANIAERMTGFGLGIGVAIGGAVILFNKMREAVKATDDAASGLGKSLAHLGGVRGPEEVHKQIEEVNASTMKLLETSSSVWSKIGNFVRGDPLLGSPGKNQTADPTSGFKAIGKLLGEETNALEQNAQIRKDSLTTGEAQVNIEKINLDVLKKKTAIEDKYKDLVLPLFDKSKMKDMTPDQLAARDKLVSKAHAEAERQKKVAEDEGNVEKAIIARRQQGKERELALEEKMATLIQKGLQPADQKKVRLGLEIKSLDDAIAKEINPENKRALILQRTQKQNEARSMAPVAPENPFEAGTSAARDWEDSQGNGGFGSLSQRNFERQDVGTFGSFGARAAELGQIPKSEKKEQNADVVQAIKEQTDVFKDAWLKTGK